MSIVGVWIEHDHIDQIKIQSRAQEELTLLFFDRWQFPERDAHRVQILSFPLKIMLFLVQSEYPHSCGSSHFHEYREDWQEKVSEDQVFLV